MKNTILINLPTKCCNLCASEFVSVVFQCLCMKKAPFLKVDIYISRGTFCSQDPWCVYRFKTFVGPTGHWWPDFKLQFAKGTERGRCCMNRVCNIPQNLQVCKLCFLENIMESQKIWFTRKSHSSIFLPTKCFHNKPLKNRVLRLWTDNINHQSSRTESCVVCRLRS